MPALPGALLQELFTRDGAGTLVSRDLYDGIRRATPADTPAILELIAPLERSGALVTRDRAALSADVHRGFYFVATRDGGVVATAQLRRFGDGRAELGCLAVAPRYRAAGRGQAMLGYLERVALAAGVEALFVLSTRTICLLYTSPSPRDGLLSRMPSSA